MFRFFALFVLLLPSYGSSHEVALLIDALEGLSEGPSVLNQCEEVPTLSESESEAFCEDPYKYVCSNPLTHRETQLKVTNDLGKEIDTKIGTNWESRSRVMEEVLSGKTKSMDSVEVMKELRLALESSIDHSSFPEEVKKDFKGRLNQIELVTANDFNRKLDAQHKARQENESAPPISKQDMELYQNMSAVCGTYGLNSVAMAEDTIKGEENKGPLKRIVLCDGALMVGGDPVKRNMMILLHEMSHFISPRYNWETYGNNIMCQIDNNSKRTFDEYEQELVKQGEETYPQDKKAQYQRSITSTQFNEVGCDLWALDAFSRIQSKRKVTPKELLSNIQESYGYFCDKGTTGAHPSGRMRIEMVGNHPEIRKMLNCKKELRRESQIKLCL